MAQHISSSVAHMFMQGMPWNKRSFAQRDAASTYFALKQPDETIHPTYEVPDSDVEVQVVENADRRSQYERKPQGLPMSKKRAAEEITARQRSGSGPSADALRLSSDYILSAPRDAKPINAPAHDSDWNPPPPVQSIANMGSIYRHGHGGHKFGNTLSSSTPHATKRMNSSANSYNQTSAGKQKQSMGLQSSRGSNVAGSPTLLDDGLVGEPPLKKIRKGSSTVDLTLDDSIDEMFSGARPHDRGRRASRSLAKSSNAIAPARRSQDRRSHFENNEMHEADSMITGSSAPKRQGATKRTAQIPHPTGPSQDLMAIEEDCPQIDLGRGMNKIGQQSAGKKQKAVQGSAEDKLMTQAVLANFLKPCARRSILQHHTSGETHAIMKARPPNSQQPVGLKLRTKFRRDNQDGVKPVSLPENTTAFQTRGSASQPSSCDDSEDELHGDNTRIAKGRHSTSPFKMSVPWSDVNKESSNEPSQQPLLSRYKPSNLTSHKQDQTATAGRNDSEDGRIGVRKLLSRRFSSHDEGLRLTWHYALNAFLLHHQDEALATSDVDDRNVSIGFTAVSQGFYTTKLQTKAILKGSTSPTNRGPICIEFESIRGKDDCFNMLDERFEIDLKNIEDDKFENMYKKQSEIEFNEFRKLKENRSPAKSSKFRHEQQIRSSAKRVRPIEDESQYNSEDHPERAITKKQRTQMQAEGSLSSALEQADFPQPRTARQHIKSHYFEKGERRSTRRAQPARSRTRSPEASEPPEASELPKWTKENKPSPWPRSVVYPSQGARRVTVDFKDLERLDEGEFLNDNVINYALRDIEESMESKHREKVHFFNTFFYTSVSTDKNGGKMKECNYDAVKKWTKNVDLFNKPYVVVPINLDLHWFVAIICNLDKVDRKSTVFDDLGQHSDDTSLEVFDDHIPLGNISSMAVEREGLQATTRSGDDSEADGSAIATDAKSELADSTTVTSDQSINVRLKRSKKRSGPGSRRCDTNSLVIVSLDSFGISRSAELKVLRQYISKEAEQRRGIELAASDLQGMKATKIPEQSNFYDCGVYLLGYVRAFAKDPDRFVHKILRREPMEEEFRDFDSAKIRVETREKLLELQTAQEEAHRAQKKARREGAKTLQTAAETSTATKTPATQAATAALKAEVERSAAEPETPSRAHSLPVTLFQQTKTSPSALQTFDGGSSQPIPSGMAMPTSETLAAEDEDDLEVAAPDTLPNDASTTYTRIKDADANNIPVTLQERTRSSASIPIRSGNEEDRIGAPNDRSEEDVRLLAFLHNPTETDHRASQEGDLPNQKCGFSKEVSTPEGPEKEASGWTHDLGSGEILGQILEIPDSQEVHQALRLQ